MWRACTYHEHVSVRFTDGYIEDTGIPRIVCREIKMANMRLGFRLEEGRVCACVCVFVLFWGGDREKEHNLQPAYNLVLTTLDVGAGTQETTSPY